MYVYYNETGRVQANIREIHEVFTALNDIGLQYDPAAHWKSKWNPNSSPPTDRSTTDSNEDIVNSASFSFPDKDSAFATYLAFQGCTDAEEWARHNVTCKKPSSLF